MAEMTVQQFNAHVGGIVMNLQAVETGLRFFLFRKNGETNPFPKPGSQEAPSSSLAAVGGLFLRKPYSPAEIMKTLSELSAA